MQAKRFQARTHLASFTIFAALYYYEVAMTTKKWIPLESNPDVLNDFATRLGLDISQYCFCDVYGLDQVRHYRGMVCSLV